jgi:hypothetical protein
VIARWIFCFVAISCSENGFGIARSGLKALVSLTVLLWQDLAETIAGKLWQGGKEQFGGSCSILFESLAPFYEKPITQINLCTLRALVLLHSVIIVHQLATMLLLRRCLQNIHHPITRLINRDKVRAPRLPSQILCALGPHIGANKARIQYETVEPLLFGIDPDAEPANSSFTGTICGIWNRNLFTEARYMSVSVGNVFLSQ